MQEGQNPNTKPAAAPADDEQEEGKKRYYTPGEVMKKKGCIGCGGMVLSVLMLVAALGWAIAAL